MDIRECTTEKEIRALYPVIRQLYALTEEDYVAYITEMRQVDYRFIAAYEAGVPVAAVGFRVGRRLYCGKYLHIDNLIVGNEHRGSGLAKQLLVWLEEEARRLDCDTVLADTYIDNNPAHRLFFGEGFHIRGFHLKKDVKNTYRTTFITDEPKERGC